MKNTRRNDILRIYSPSGAEARIYEQTFSDRGDKLFKRLLLTHHLFALSDAELAAHGAIRRIADGPRPCRISLSDAKPGDEIILVNYEHHAVSSPYRMRFAIYIRRGEETFDAIGEVPEQLRKRTLAVRGFDASGMMTGWEIVEGSNVEAALERQFENPKAQYLHIHFAAPGCYAARVDRVG